MSTISSRSSHHAIIAEDGLPVTCVYCGRKQIVYVLDWMPTCICVGCWNHLDRIGVVPIDQRFTPPYGQVSQRKLSVSS